MPAYDKADIQRRMHGAVEALKHDLGGLRTGRASTALLDPIKVEVYGANMPLNQVATVSVPEPRMLSVQVWDRGNVSPVEKAIRTAGLGLNPIIDGQMIRLPIPDLTEERRKELAKLAGQYAEKARIAVRNVRRDGMDALKTDEKKHEISEDEHKRLEAEVQKLTDDDDRRDRRGGARQGKGNPRQVSLDRRRDRRGRRPPCMAERAACRATSRSSWTATAAGRRKRGLPRVAGHRAGAEAVRKALAAPRARRASKCLTLYAFSSENWRRSEEEISRPHGPAALLSRARARRRSTQEGVRLALIGDHTAFGAELVARLERAVRAHRRQQPADPGRRAQLRRRAARSPARRGALAAKARGGRARPGDDRRGDARRRAGDRRPAGARPADPHLGRGAAVQFPAVAGGLCRAGVPRHAVARFRRGGVRRGARRIMPARQRRFGGR